MALRCLGLALALALRCGTAVLGGERERESRHSPSFPFNDFVSRFLFFSVRSFVRRCIFAEMATGRPLLTGTSESDQLARIFRQMGTPTPLMYPGLQELPDYRVRQTTYLHLEVDKTRGKRGYYASGLRVLCEYMYLGPEQGGLVCLQPSLWDDFLSAGT